MTNLNPIRWARLAAVLVTAACVSAAAAADPVVPAAGLAVPADARVGKIYPVRATAQNRAVRLDVLNASLETRYARLRAAAGRRLLVVGTEWENVISAVDVGEQKDVTTAYKVPHLDDLLYVVVDGRTVGRLATKANGVAGHVPVVDFSIPKVGDRVGGNVAFDVPADGHAFQLRFYDLDHGVVAVDLNPQPPAAKATAEPTPSNEAVSAGVYGVEHPAEVNGAKPPAGLAYAVVDVRAASRATTPKPVFSRGEPPAIVRQPTVADWTDARKYLQLEADGQYGSAPIVGAGSLADAPRLLPDVPTGGTVAFLVPADAKVLQLRCDFPAAVLAGNRTVHPKGFDLPVSGGRPGPLPELPKPVVAIDDDVFRVTVDRQTVEGSLLVLDVTVQHTGQEGGDFFQTKDQLKLVGSDGKSAVVDDSSYGRPHGPSDLLWVPAGRRRSFQVAFPLAAGEARPRLGYSGVSKADVVALTPLAAPATGAPVVAQPKQTQPPEVASAVATPPAVAPPDAPAAGPSTPVVVKQPPPPGATVKVDGQDYPARVPVHPPGLTARGLAGVGLTQEQVNASIDRGAAGLWAFVSDRAAHDRTNFGHNRHDRLVALALIHADYHHKNPAFDAALRKYLGGFKADWQDDWANTYDVGLLCMAIEAYGDPSFAPQLRQATQWLVDTQGKDGTWGYGFNTRDPAAPPPVRRTLVIAGGHPPGSPPAGGDPVARQLPWERGVIGDNSVTQFALLGLHAAVRSGVRVPAESFKRLYATTLARQSDDGGWCYQSGSGGYGSMTCAGASALALSHYDLNPVPAAAAVADDPAGTAAVERGLAWLNAHFTVDNHPNSKDQWVYYYLYSLERVGRILDTEFVGEHEWYPLGCRHLLGEQRPDGMWVGRGGESLEDRDLPTSFALLFLTRATPALNATQHHDGPGTLRTAAVVPPGYKLYVILDCSGSMLEEMGGRQKLDVAKDAVKGLLDVVPDNSDVALRAYGHRLRATQPKCDEDTELLAPLAPLDRKKLGGLIDHLRARGKTPMALSLTDAAAEVRSAAADPDRPVTVVLLTDGGEDTRPRQDPVKAAALLGKVPNVRLRIVGFDINQADWGEQLAAMARAAGGQYVAASAGDQLARELKASVFGVPDTFDLTDAAGRPVQTAAFGTTLQLPAGKYNFVTAFAGRRFAEPIWISPGETTAATFDAAAIAAELPADAAAADPAPAQAAPAAKRFCSNCGAPLRPGAKFCGTCGARVHP